MIFGHVRDGFPFLSIDLPGLSGAIAVECILDTGFDGYLIMPPQALNRIECEYVGERDAVLADRTVREVPAYKVQAHWLGNMSAIEVLEMDGRPLMGGRMVDDQLIQIEMRTGGEVVVEPL